MDRMMVSCMKSNDVKVKVIANYLPQYHRIPENDKWWGTGYTDWVATKNAKPLFEGHRQPRVPLNENYYNLSDVNAIRWQAELAKKYGVYGFGIYHYWFSSKLQLLQKPAELLLANKDIDIHFMFIWDNGSWKRTWSNVKGNDWVLNDESKDKDDFRKGNGILAELKYGDEVEWKKHFEYLLPFFKDERYVKIEGRPMLGFWNVGQETEIIRKIVAYWDILAQKNGLPGILCMSKYDWKMLGLRNMFNYLFFEHFDFIQAVIEKVHRIFLRHNPLVYSYDYCWNKVLSNSKKVDGNTLLSGFVGYDDTPRRGLKGTVVEGSTPAKFRKYFTELLKISRAQGKEYVFCPAWNEWGEGMYLEPDTLNGYGYLEALKAAVDEVNGED